MFESWPHASHFVAALRSTWQRHNTVEIQVAGNFSSKIFCASSVKISGILEGAI
jgi:hypothetical protein